MKKLTPTKMRNLYYESGGEGRFQNWTQIEKLVEWPPAEKAVFFFYDNSVIVGASAGEGELEALDAWRRKYSVRTVPLTPYTNRDTYTGKASRKHDAEWYEMYKQGMRQSDIARALGVSPAYVSIIKRRMRMDNPLDIV